MFTYSSYFHTEEKIPDRKTDKFHVCLTKCICLPIELVFFRCHCSCVLVLCLCLMSCSLSLSGRCQMRTYMHAILSRVVFIFIRKRNSRNAKLTNSLLHCRGMEPSKDSTEKNKAAKLKKLFLTTSTWNTKQTNSLFVCGDRNCQGRGHSA